MSLEIDAAAAHGDEGDALFAELLVDDLHHRRQHEEARRQAQPVTAARQLLRQLGGGLAEWRELPREGLEKLDSGLCVAHGSIVHEPVGHRREGRKVDGRRNGRAPLSPMRAPHKLVP